MRARLAIIYLFSLCLSVPAVSAAGEEIPDVHIAVFRFDPATDSLIAAYDGRPTLKSWLRVVALRTAREAGMRGPKARTRTELAEAEQALLASGERQALDTCLASVMAHESAQDRLLFALSEIEVLSAAESAHLVGSDPRRVDGRLRRLRKRLRQTMERTLQKELGYDKRGLEDYWKRARRVVRAET